MKHALQFPIAVALLLATCISQGATCLSDRLGGGDGRLDLAQFRGRVVYVDFWASWCGPCKQSFPFMNALHSQFKDKGVTVLAITVDKDLKDATDFLKEHPADFLVSRDIDGKCAKEMQLKGMPSSYIIGKNGEVAYTHVGFRPSDKDAIVKKLQEISAN